MASHTKILNLTGNRRIKRSQAVNRIEQGISVWVEQNRTIRDLDLAEMVAIRATMARAEATRCLEAAELPGLVYRPSESAREGEKMYRGCLVAAREFALSCN